MLGRYTTGPVVARAEHSRWTGVVSRRHPRQSQPILAAHAPDRPAQRHRHQALAGDAPGDGRGRGRRRRLRRRPDGHRPRGARRRAARQGGRPLRRLGDDGQPRRPAGPPAPRPGDDRRSRAPPRHRRGRRPRGHRRHQHPLARGPAGRHDGPRRDRRRLPRPDRPPRADHRPHHHREHPRPLDGPAADPRLHPAGRGDRAPTRHPAPRRWRPVLGCRRQPAGRGRHRHRPVRPGRQRHVLPVEGPRLPGRLGGRRVARLHLAGAPGAQAGRWRDAPGGDPGRGRPRRPVGRARTG